MTAKEFKALRAAAGLTIRAVADILDVTEPTVWAWENGKRPIPSLKEDGIRARLAAHVEANR